ncbi:peptidase, partial [Streptomyces albiflaviniger]|nr:peptidase [Streptomyces albiflaviniger]
MKNTSRTLLAAALVLGVVAGPAAPPVLAATSSPSDISSPADTSSPTVSERSG